MKLRALLPTLFAVTALAGAATASAAPSCTDWMKQAGGPPWRTCVDDAGKQYCEQADKKGKITRVKC